MQPNSVYKGMAAVAGLWVEPNHLLPLGGGLVHTTQLSESSGGRAVHTLQLPQQAWPTAFQ